MFQRLVEVVLFLIAVALLLLAVHGCGYTEVARVQATPENEIELIERIPSLGMWHCFHSSSAPGVTFALLVERESNEFVTHCIQSTGGVCDVWEGRWTKCTDLYVLWVLGAE